MDPISISLGAMPLVFQVFALCVKGYQLLSEARGLEEKHEFFRVRFKMEQCRLVDWAHVVQLSEDDQTLLLNKACRPTLLEILEQIYRLLMRFGRLDDHLRPFARPLLREDKGPVDRSQVNSRYEPAEEIENRFPHADRLEKRALDLMRDVKSIPARLRWVVSDKEQITVLLQKLSGYNNWLHELLSSQQMETLVLQEIRTQYQILQLNSKIDDLRELVEAGFDMAAGRQTDDGGPRATTSSIRLAQLAQFKALNTAINRQSPTSELFHQMKLDYPQDDGRLPAKLSPDDIQLSVEPEKSCEERTFARLRISPKVTRPIWVEWHSVETDLRYQGRLAPDVATLRRFEALVALLRENSYSKLFRAPRCLGYYLEKHSHQRFQYGLVFENPADVEAHYLPVSLAELLEDRTRPIPSLTRRLKLMRVMAESIEKLHAVSWLHKGLRSQNILFFCEDKRHADLTDPYLSGFDYSRPAIETSMSEGLPPKPLDNLYRHPSVQGGIRDEEHGIGYTALHDIYSLGVVFVEISYWKPIYEVLGIPDLETIKTRDISGVRSKLLGEETLGYIKSYLGDTVLEVIRACITGESAFDVAGYYEETSGPGRAKLQAMFYEVVVKRLQGIHT